MMLLTPGARQVLARVRMVAQALSTRVDILSPEYLLQIELLQDRVPPFPTREALDVMAAGAMACLLQNN